jgi:endonuclease/exonuclease/phosphatase family metal-dependent hydrolase
MLEEHLQTDDPLILLGDFNTVKQSDVTATEQRLESFYTNNPAVAAKLKPLIDDMCRGEVITQLEMQDLKDAGEQNVQPTIPTPLFPATTAGPLLRLDYCLHTPAVIINNFTVLTGNTFDQASDHYPIVFDISA